MWIVNILTLFPELFPGPLNHSITGRGLKNQLWAINAYNIREFAIAKQVDDTPFGGGNGMVIRPDVLANAIRSKFMNGLPIIYLSPRGILLTQNYVRSLVQNNNGINIICGRFEGIDERILQIFNIIEVSIGDYILSCGDIASYVLIDACLRNIPGMLNANNSLNEESFGKDEYEYLLEYPQYTRPATFEDINVPNILLSGNHDAIKKWRLKQAQIKTMTSRPDLWQKYNNK